MTLSLAPDGGDGVWAGFESGLARIRPGFPPEIHTADTSELPHDYVHDLGADQAGGVWIGSSLSLCRLAVSRSYGKSDHVSVSLPDPTDETVDYLALIIQEAAPSGP